MKESFKSPGTHWTIINVFLILVFTASGFLGDKPTEFDSARFGIIFCAVVIVVIPAWTIAWLYFSKAELKTPAWNRCPFGSGDPLQTMFIGTWCGFAGFVSALAQLPRFSGRFIWTVAICGCVFLAFVIGRIVAYRLFRDRIR